MHENKSVHVYFSYHVYFSKLKRLRVCVYFSRLRVCIYFSGNEYFSKLLKLGVRTHIYFSKPLRLL